MKKNQQRIEVLKGAIMHGDANITMGLVQAGDYSIQGDPTKTTIVVNSEGNTFISICEDVSRPPASTSSTTSMLKQFKRPEATPDNRVLLAELKSLIQTMPKGFDKQNAKRRLESWKGHLLSVSENQAINTLMAELQTMQAQQSNANNNTTHSSVVSFFDKAIIKEGETFHTGDIICAKLIIRAGEGTGISRPPVSTTSTKPPKLPLAGPGNKVLLAELKSLIQNMPEGLGKENAEKRLERWTGHLLSAPEKQAINKLMAELQVMQSQQSNANNTAQTLIDEDSTSMKSTFGAY